MQNVPGFFLTFKMIFVIMAISYPQIIELVYFPTRVGLLGAVLKRVILVLRI